MSFIGRQKELNLLMNLRKKMTASLVVIRGRRRIGKSRLAEEFGKSFKKMITIQGLAPHDGSSKQSQLDHFSERLSQQTSSRKQAYADWTEALHDLAQKTRKTECLILLDEVSWMGKHDPSFSAKIKEAWDTGFRLNPRLILIVCGSVSSWIEDEIVKNRAFEGRISLDLTVEDLLLPEINEFWKKGSRHAQMGSFEKTMLLSVTGGVPKYIEEVLDAESAEANLMRLCYEPTGFLFNEYDKIFGEIFQRRAATMEKIVRACLSRKLSPVELARVLNTPLNSDFSENIRILELAGFISRDVTFKVTGEASKLTHLRVKDNYLRFYLKHIEPMKARIEKGGKQFTRFSDLKAYEGILGFQFENLILANRTLLYPHLSLEHRDIITAAPYVQKKNQRTKAGCQIDLLIHTNLDVFYLCEMKCKKEIDASVIAEVQTKMKALMLPKRSSVKPILIYEGEIYPSQREKLEGFFFRMIPFSDLIGTA